MAFLALIRKLYRARPRLSCSASCDKAEERPLSDHRGQCEFPIFAVVCNKLPGGRDTFGELLTEVFLEVVRERIIRPGFDIDLRHEYSHQGSVLFQLSHE